jgi:hypothetical protein
MLNFSRQGLYKILAVLFFLYLIACWLYKLDISPGLHGDEAWIGIVGEYFEGYHIDRIVAMNYYTGILEAAMVSCSFALFNISLFSLRIGGVIFNIIALLIVCKTTTIIKAGSEWTFSFLMVLCQSALFLTSPRVAWEVNSFTLFFIALIFLSVLQISLNKAHQRAWMLVLLWSSLLSSYNHIILSAITVSAFIALLIWTIYNNNYIYKKLLLLFGTSILNQATVFLLMKYFALPLARIVELLPVIFFVILYAQVLLVEFVYTLPIWSFKSSVFHRRVMNTILSIMALCFCLFHGRAFFDLLAGDKVFLQNYAYETSRYLCWVLYGCAIVFICYLLAELWQDMNKTASSIFAIFIVVYMGVLCVYVTQVSFRYYLTLNVFIILYISFKMSSGLKRYRLLLVSLSVACLIMGSMQFHVFFDQDRPLKAVHFKIGNGQNETSAHFLPKEKVIDFLKENKIAQMYYPEDAYFLNLPIEFYRTFQPWVTKPGTKAVVTYDYSSSKNKGHKYYLLR